MTRPRAAAVACALVAGLAVPSAQGGYEYPSAPANPPPVTYALSVAKDGSAAGTVTSTPAGIACGSDCSESYAAGTSVTLVATPDAGATFTGWSGACTGTGTCSVTLDADRTVTASFAPAAAATPADTTVTAGLAAVNVARDAWGRRVVRATLTADERLRVVVRLVRGSRSLASRTLASFAAGQRTIELRVPRGVAGGRARLELDVRDGAGNTASFSRSVRLPVSS